MYLNIILILFLVICLLNITNSKKFNGGGNSNKELELHKKMQSDINSLKNKLKEIDSEITMNKKTLEKYKNVAFTSTTRTQMFETQIIIKNLLTEKEKTINLLDKTLKKYDKLLIGGKKIDPLDKIEKEQKKKLKQLENDPVVDTGLLSKSQEITKEVGIIMGESIPTVKPQGPIKIEHIPASTANNDDDDDDSDDETGEINADSSEDDYVELISEEEDLDNEAANNIAQDMEREQFNDSMQAYLEANSNSVD